MRYGPFRKQCDLMGSSEESYPNLPQISVRLRVFVRYWRSEKLASTKLPAWATYRRNETKKIPKVFL